jgi:hypothetical protein
MVHASRWHTMATKGPIVFLNKLVYDQRIQPMKQRLVEDAHTQKDSEFRQLSTTF